jgi:hypothetical protein
MILFFEFSSLNTILLIMYCYQSKDGNDELGKCLPVTSIVRKS